MSNIKNLWHEGSMKNNPLQSCDRMRNYNPAIFCFHWFLGTKLNLALYHITCQQDANHTVLFLARKKLQICFRIIFDFHFIYVVWFTNARLTYQNFLNDYDHIKLLLNINQNRTSIIGITLRFSCVMLQNILSCILDFCIITLKILFAFVDIYFEK